MASTNYIGIDMAKDSFVVNVYEQKECETFANTPENFSKFKESYKNKPTAEVKNERLKNKTWSPPCRCFVLSSSKSIFHVDNSSNNIKFYMISFSFITITFR